MDYSQKKEGYYPIPYEEEPFKTQNYEPTPIKASSIIECEDGEKVRKKKKKKGHKKSFCVCCSNVEIGSRRMLQPHDGDDEKNKSENERKKKKKLHGNGFLCSKVEIESEEEREEAHEIVEKMKNKSSFLICCSNIEVCKGQEKKSYFT